MRTAYESHDLAYQRKRAAGDLGWGSAQDFAEHFASLDKVLARGALPRAGRLLELGCGAGNVSRWLARQGYTVDGLDIAPTAIAWAMDAAAAEGVAGTFRVGTVLDLAAYEDQAFDVVLDGHCLHCIIGADRARVLASARRVLRPDGALCVHTMCGDPTNDALRATFDPESRCLVRDDIASRYLGLPDAITGEVVAAGFDVTFSELELARDGDDQSMLLLVARPTRSPALR